MIAFNSITLKIHERTLLSETSLRIAPGDKVVIRGASGGGKSSLMKTAVGAMPLSGGSITIDETELSAQTVAGIRGKVSFIGQEPVLGADRVRDALLLPFTFSAHSENPPSEKRMDALLERMHLSSTILDKPCNRISGGEKQRIAIIRALLLDKSIFIADEVTSALDPESKAAVMAELFQPEITLLSVSHDPEWINACGRVVDISDGKLVENSHDR